MKNQLRKLLNVALLVSLIILSSCEKDLYDEAIKEESRIKVDKFSLKDLMESNEKKLNVSTIEAKLLNAVEKVKSKNEENRIQYNSEKGYYFDDENGLVVTKEDYQSYIFKIYREQHNEVSKLENIVFSLNENGEFDSYIIKYDATEEQIRDNESLVFDILSVDEIDIENTEAGRIIVIEFLNSLCHTPPNCYGSICGIELVSFMMVEPHESTTGNINNFPDSNGAGFNPNMVLIPNSGYSPLTRQFVNKLIGNLSIDYFYALSLETQASILAYVDSLPTNAANNVVVAFLNQQNTFWLSDQTLATQTSTINYLIQNNFSTESVSFVNEIKNLAVAETNQADVSNLVNLSLKLKNAGANLSEADFALTIDPYIDIDVANYNAMNPNDPLLMYFSIQCAVLRANHQDWSDAKVYWEASKDMIHISLDILGLVPVVGEVADLTNGVLYTIEGDGVNATLSVASAVPIAGWAAVSTKYAVKIIDASQTATTIATNVKLTWKVVGNTIEFGSKGQLRKVLGITASNIQAHHLIPWSSQTKMAVQKAAKYGGAFHMNEALNGIAVAAWRNQPNHNAYNALIDSKLDTFRDLYPNATPQECYNFLTDLINDIRTWVINNPNSHLNDLVLP
jgi:hypothetical protein